MSDEERASLLQQISFWKASSESFEKRLDHMAEIHAADRRFWAQKLELLEQVISSQRDQVRRLLDAMRAT